MKTSSLAFAFLAAASPVVAVLNLNLKSSHLSRLLREPTTASSTTTTSTTTTGHDELNPKTDLLQLDLSGTVDTLVSGPEDSRGPALESPVRPLFPTPGPFSFILSANYDFSRAWYGMTDFLATLRWTRHHSRLKGAGILPSKIDLIAKQSLSGSKAVGEISVSFDDPTRENGPLNLRAKGGHSGITSVHMALPVHRRADLQLTLFNGNRLPGQIVARKNEDWWIPDVSINALGHLKSQNDGWFESPLRQIYRGSLGFRFVVRRALGWSVLGLTSAPEPETWFGLDVKTVDQDHSYASTLRILTQSKRPIESARIAWKLAVAPCSKVKGVLCEHAIMARVDRSSNAMRR